VIHVRSLDQVERNIELVFAAGLNQVFLINHGIYTDKLLKIAEKILDTYPKLWVGVNLLGRQDYEEIDPRIKGYWTDHLISDKRPKQEYFGGFAFKYQRNRANYSQEACDRAITLCDVITTSGEGTGIAADLEKIRTIRSRIGDYPLALASGVRPDNIKSYAGLVDHYLVATGISKDFHNFDPDKLRALVEAYGE
jgi:hypothetical protein